MPLYRGDPPASHIPRLRPADVAATLDAGETPRTARLRRYRSYYDGTAYVGRVPFLDSRFDSPLRERAPCVVSDAVRAAARANAARCVGEGRFPKITSLQSEDDASLDERFGLDPEESALVDAVVAKIIDQADLHTASRVALEQAQAVGTAVTIQSVDGAGHLSVADVPAEWCSAAFDPLVPDVVAALEIRYRFLDVVHDEARGDWFTVVREFLRTIDARSDVTYLPRLIAGPKVAPQNLPPFVEASRVDHELGFCPVAWWPFLRGTATISDNDGRAIHDGQLDNLDALNFALSQRHRGALVCGEPQYFETGVGEDESVAAGTRAAAVESSNPGAYPTASNPLGEGVGAEGALKTAAPKGGGWAFGFGPGGGRRRQRSPLSVWHSENPEARFGMMAMPGDGLKALDDHATSLLAMLRESFGSVFVDPSMLKGSSDISGKALAVLNERQIAFCDSVRRDFWRRWLKPVVCQLLRIAKARASSGLYLPGAAKAAPILARFEQSVSSGGAASSRWFDPQLVPRFGDYFAPSDNDESVAVATATTAKASGLITEKTAIEKIASVFGIENPDQYADALAAERDEKAKIAADAAAKLAEQRAANVGTSQQVPTDPAKTNGNGAVGDAGPRKVPSGADPADESRPAKGADA